MSSLLRKLPQFVRRSLATPQVVRRSLGTLGSLERFSWRNVGCYTRVRRQPPGACQVSSVIACMELGYQLHYGKRILLSDGEIADLGRVYGTFSTPLAYPKRTFCDDIEADWIKDLGVGLWRDYGYAIDGLRVILYDYHVVRIKDPYHLLHAIIRQPIVIPLKGIGKNFAEYKEGYYCGESPEVRDLLLDEEEVASDPLLNEMIGLDLLLDEEEEVASDPSLDDMIGLDSEEEVASDLLLNEMMGSDSDPAVVATGWCHHNGELFIEIQNSWGRQWGVDGYAVVHPSCIRLDDFAGIPQMISNTKDFHPFATSLDEVPKIEVNDGWTSGTNVDDVWIPRPTELISSASL